MHTFRITVINQTFRASNDDEFASLADASRQGIKSALEIGMDEVVNGKPFFGAEIKIEKMDETVGRYIVSVGVTPIQQCHEPH